ncbi:MAG: hypothetical protein HC896_15385 [Bacteroidales bacterium]|nr:hypothetical protein [Bacteroidales bacterium]
MAIYKQTDTAITLVDVQSISEGTYKFYSIDSGYYYLYAIPNPDWEDAPAYFVKREKWELSNVLHVYGNMTEVNVYLTKTNFIESGKAQIKGQQL